MLKTQYCGCTLPGPACTQTMGIQILTSHALPNDSTVIHSAVNVTAICFQLGTLTNFFFFKDIVTETLLSWIFTGS